MSYAKIDNGAVVAGGLSAYDAAYEIRAAHPDLALPDTPGEAVLARYGYLPEARAPLADRYQIHAAPVIESGRVSYPAVDMPLEDAREKIKTRIEAARDTALEGGFSFEGRHYDSRPPSIDNIIGSAVQAGLPGGLPPGFAWRDAGNEYVPMDNSMMQAFAATAFSFRNNVYLTSFALKNAVDEAQSVDEVRAIQHAWLS